MTPDLPILYSFRRCPYAMRARMSIAACGQNVRLREVVLRDKPADMLEASPKGTVPVLVLRDGHIIDESLDVIFWALQINDPDGWLTPENGSLSDMKKLISECDGPFKHHLDRFKYSTRYNDVDPDIHRDQAGAFLHDLNERLADSAYLFGNKPAVADIAVFPFVRQFAGAAGDWFRDGRFPALVPWLDALVNSSVFKNVMRKYPQWQQGDVEPIFPDRPGST